MLGRACGSLVCSACSPYKSDIPFLQEEGGSRVCKNCFGLRTDIYAAPLKDDTPTRIMTQQSMAAGANGIFSPGDGRVIRRGSSTKSTTVPMDDPEVLAQIEKKLSYEYEAAYRYHRHTIHMISWLWHEVISNPPLFQENATPYPSWYRQDKFAATDDHGLAGGSGEENMDN